MLLVYGLINRAESRMGLPQPQIMMRVFASVSYSLRVVASKLVLGCKLGAVPLDGPLKDVGPYRGFAEDLGYYSRPGVQPQKKSRIA